MKKLFGFLLMLSVLCLLPVVHAHDIVIDPDDVIKVAVDDKGQISSKTKVVVDESFGEYTLSYQYVLFSGDAYDSYNEFLQAQLTYEKESKPDEDASTDVIKAYQEKMESFENSKRAVTPGYDESKWIESKDGTVPLDAEAIKNAKGDEVYALWVKVTSKADATKVVYEDNVVIYQIAEEETSPSTSDNVLVIGLLAVASMGFVALSYKKSRA